jgi:hypothetical protein
LTTANNSVYLGYNTRGFNNSDSNSIVIGASAIGIGANTVVLGNDSIVTTALKGSVGIGTASPGSKCSILGNSSIGATYALLAAPANGLIVEGWTGHGTSAPKALLHVAGTSYFKSSMVIIAGTDLADGDWNFIISGADLLIQKRVSGAWVTKLPILGA